MNSDLYNNIQTPQQHIYLLLPMDPTDSVPNNTQVIPLHIPENNINSEYLMPYAQIEEGPVQQLFGAEEVLSVEYDPVTNQITTKAKSQSKELSCHTNSNKPKTLLKNVQQSIHTPKVAQSSSVTNPIDILNYPLKALNKNSQHYGFETPPKKSDNIHPHQMEYMITSKFFENNQLTSLLSNQNTATTSDQSQNGCAFSQNLAKQTFSHQLDFDNKTSVIVETSSINFQPVESINTTLVTDPISAKSSLLYNQDKFNTDFYTDQTKMKKLKNFVHINDMKVVPRALATLPSALQIRGKDRNIYPRRSLAACTRFGPIEGIQQVITQSEADNLVSTHDGPVFLLKKDNQIIHIDVSDLDKCNWMGLLQIDGKANVWLYQEDEKLYAISTNPIIVRTPLRLGYSTIYAEEHKLPTRLPTLDLDSVIGNPERWWCGDCNRALPSSALLQRHNDIYHKTEKFVKGRGIYRCRQCKRAFGRIFTLRRHMANHCSKTNVKPENTPTRNSQDLISSTPNEEKIPSDESFQNFTSGLDFSSSLFDTDKIPNLDISLNSRGDNDFNPYGIELRDDSNTSNDLNLLKSGSLCSENVSEAKIKSQSEICTYCNEAIIKKHMRRHVRECPSRRLQCCCGQLFRNKTKLALHILKEHPIDPINQEVKEDHVNDDSSLANAYKCDKCKHSFKRRGMLVNHLWRKHKLISTAPVVRPVRHYPCVVCPKIYRSSAKRNQHVKAHHPGAEKLRAQTISGGVKSCEAAACPACPHQYATHAKLMQHVRATHPDLVSQLVKSRKRAPISSAKTKDTQIQPS